MVRKENLLKELKEIKNREVEILAELLGETSLVESEQETRGNAVRIQPSILRKGDRVRVLTRGVNAKKGDTGKIIVVTKTQFLILLDRTKSTTRRGFKNVEKL